MKIGFFIDTFFPMIDGVVMVVDNYARRLSKNHEVTVFCPEYPGTVYDDSGFPYKVIRCQSAKVPFLDYSLPVPDLDLKFTAQLLKYDLDLVHIHSPFSMGQSGLRYALAHHVPAVATMHSQYRQDIEKALRSKTLIDDLMAELIGLYDKCDECWAVSGEIARLFYEDYGCKTLPSVMGNATEMLPVKDVDAARQSIDKKHGLKPDQKVFLFVGRINTLKNIFFIVDALQQLNIKLAAEEKPAFYYRMLFVGSGKEEEDLKSYVTERGIDEQITLCGRVTDRSELENYYARADLFLFPSLYDASSIVQIEAAAQKTPTIFLRGAATASNIKEGHNGYISENDPVAFADMIYSAMTEEDTYRAISDAAYNELYVQWDDVVSRAEKRYLELIEKKKSEPVNEDNLLKKIVEKVKDLEQSIK
ncbi:MAG: glycosyltransferase [Oscillospiraceae bacterium]|nr:glycosyltransferase [Oscillospiraceae bacterium]